MPLDALLRTRHAFIALLTTSRVAASPLALGAQARAICERLGPSAEREYRISALLALAVLSFFASQLRRADEVLEQLDEERLREPFTPERAGLFAATRAAVWALRGRTADAAALWSSLPLEDTQGRTVYEVQRYTLRIGLAISAGEPQRVLPRHQSPARDGARLGRSGLDRGHALDAGDLSARRRRDAGERRGDPARDRRRRARRHRSAGLLPYRAAGASAGGVAQHSGMSGLDGHVVRAERSGDGAAHAGVGDRGARPDRAAAFSNCRALDDGVRARCGTRAPARGGAPHRRRGSGSAHARIRRSDRRRPLRRRGVLSVSREPDQSRPLRHPRSGAARRDPRRAGDARRRADRLAHARVRSAGGARARARPAHARVARRAAVG